jgi:hypothetical protein
MSEHRLVRFSVSPYSANALDAETERELDAYSSNGWEAVCMTVFGETLYVLLRRPERAE